jgi:hypothetical protein
MSTRHPSRPRALVNRLRQGKLLALAALGAALLAAPLVRGQFRPSSGLPTPRLLVASPAGGKAGTTVEVTLAGIHIEEAEKLVFSHPAIKAELVEDRPPAPPDPKGKPKRKGRRRGMGPPGSAKFKVTIPASVPVGIYDVRLVNKWGVSNPRAFAVGDLNEVPEKEPNDEDTKAQRVDINTTVNGAFSNPADVDYYVFAGKKGQRVVLSCLASSIDSRAQPGVEVYDAKDRLLASNRAYHRYDALTDVTLPADGDYFVRVVQFAHTFRFPLPLPQPLPPGTFDYFYRLSITTAPWVDAVHPCVLEPGKTTSVTVWGRNLPGGKPDPGAVVDDCVLEKVTAKVTAPAAGAAPRLHFSGTVGPESAALDGFEYRTRNASGSSNPYLLMLARAPVVLDKGDNDTPEKAQEISPPCEIAGRVEKRRDRDWYAFKARKGEVWNIAVSSRRAGAPTYMSIRLRNPATKADLYEPQPNDNVFAYTRQFFTRSEDPEPYRFVVPADGTYQLLVYCQAADSLASPRKVYRVRITRDEPDFRLVAMSAETLWPDAPTLSPGGQQALAVLAFREGGFTGDIELSAEDLPPGVTCTPQVLAGAVRQTTLVLSAAPTAGAWTGAIKVKGTATVNGKKVVREARSGCLVWPSSPNPVVPSISRLDHSLMLAVRGKAPYKLNAKADKETVKQGDKAAIKVSVDRLWPEFKGPLQVQVMQGQFRQGSELPINLRVNNNQPFNLAPGAKEGSLAVTAGPDVPPGVYNIVLRGQAQVPYNKDPTSKAKQPTFVIQPSNPVSITVLPKSLAQLALSNPNLTVKVGGKAEVLVRVARQFNYAGEFKVQLVLPAGVQGVSAQEVTIPAGGNEAKLVVEAPADAKPGFRGNLTVRAVALFNGKVPTNHEVKLNVNVVK